jgi:hypothetical protein
MQIHPAASHLAHECDSRGMPTEVASRDQPDYYIANRSCISCALVRL